MADDNKVENSADPVVYDLDSELRKSSPPDARGHWLWPMSWVMVISSIPVAFLLESWIVLLGGFCFGLVLMGLDVVVDKLNEVLFELRCK